MFTRTTGIHAYLDSAKKRVGEMDRSLARLERMAKEVKGRRQSAKLVTELKRRRDHFAATTREMKAHLAQAEARFQKLSRAAATSLSAYRAAAAKSRKAFLRAGKRTGRAVRRAVK